MNAVGSTNSKKSREMFLLNLNWGEKDEPVHPDAYPVGMKEGVGPTRLEHIHLHNQIYI